MKTKETFKCFRNMLKRTGGFTLVELIVVIAILAILAGVAIPAYSGYITKANEAADQQLLSAINTAFAAACIENGVAPNTVSNASIQVSSKVIGKVTGVNATTGNPAGVSASFDTYFAGNAGAAFKVYESLKYNEETHIFEGAVAIRKDFGGGFVTMNSTDLNNLANSVFGKDIAGTLQLVDDVSALVGGLSGSDAMSAALSNDAFLNSVLMTMGKTPEEIAAMSRKDKEDAALAQNQKLAAEVMAKNPGMTPEQAAAQVQGNALVLYAAQQTGKMDKNDMKEFLAGANSETLSVVVGNMSSADKSGEGVAQAALICGMYASYVKNDPTKDQTVNVQTVMAALNTPEFQDYLSDSSNYEADLDGYVSSLNMVNSSAEDLKSVEYLMINGFAGSGLEGIISDALIGD